MFTKSVIAAAALVATAGSAFAMDAPSKGAQMLAAIVGVEPGVYAVNDLIRLDDLSRESNSQNEVAYILSEGRDGISGRADTSFGSIATGAGADQLARTVGVDAGAFSTAELTLLNDAIDNDEPVYASYIENGGLRKDVAGSVSASPARQQLAGPLNVDAADFTLSQLVRLDAAVADRNQAGIATILTEAGVTTTVAQILR